MVVRCAFWPPSASPQYPSPPPPGVRLWKVAPGHVQTHAEVSPKPGLGSRVSGLGFRVLNLKVGGGPTATPRAGGPGWVTGSAELVTMHRFLIHNILTCSLVSAVFRV